MRVCKKPVAVEAVRYKGADAGTPQFAEAPLWLLEALDALDTNVGAVFLSGGGLTINTLEGPMRVEADAWVVRGVQGELYAVRGDVFDATYEPAEDAEARAELATLQQDELDEAREALNKALAKDGDDRLLAAVTPLASGIRLLARSELGHRAALSAATERGDRLVVAVLVDGAPSVVIAGPDRDQAACERFAKAVAEYYDLLVRAAEELARKEAAYEAEQRAAEANAMEGPAG